MKNNREILLHLSLIYGIGPTLVLKFIKKLFNEFVAGQRHPEIQKKDFDLSMVYELGQNDFERKFSFTKNQAESIVNGLQNKALLSKELELIEKYKIDYHTFLDLDYPEILKSIYSPPIMIYSKGKPLNTYKKTLAIVGARKSTSYSQRVLDKIIPELVFNDISIVSGGALGVDTIAHKSTIDAGGRTIVVLGSGILSPYPERNIKFFKKVANGGGTLVSIFPLRMGPDRGTFPARNRVIAGLSTGCLVVEAAQKSGALITAKFALDEGRNVFAIPGNIESLMSVGCNNLIKQGAKLVNSVNDILEDYGITIVENDDKVSEVSAAKKIATTVSLEKKEKRLEVTPKNNMDKQASFILSSINMPLSLDNLSIKLNLDIEVLQEKLFDLELDGKIRQNMAGFWERT